VREAVNSARVTFRGNLTRRRHGWLRLTPAYSVQLVERLVGDLPARTHVLDPFCGTGTTLLTCAEQGLRCTTVDLNPFLVWLANTKARDYSPKDRARARGLVLRMADASKRAHRTAPWLPPISNIDRWWEHATQLALGRAFAVLCRSKHAAPVLDLARVCFCRALITSAKVSFGHQSMSFQTSAVTRSPVPALLDAALGEVSEGAGLSLAKPGAGALLGDARALRGAVKRRRFDAVITSPPYCNRMSYIRELRPYMYWLGHLDLPSSAGELDWRAIGGTWGVATSRLTRWEPPKPTRRLLPELVPLLQAIAAESKLLARYVERYFSDMTAHFASLSEVLRPGGKAYYVVGNSKFYDVVLPTERLLATQMERLGFGSVHVDTLRTRTSKAELFEYLITAVKR
jgi:DNA modification methylase